MEILVIVVIIIIILLIVIAVRSGRKSTLDEVAYRLSDLSLEIRELRKQIEKLSNQPGISSAPPPPEIVKPAAPIPTREETKPVITTVPKEEAVQKQFVPEKSIPVFEAPSPKPKAEPVHQEPKAGWYDTWLKNNPDMEKFIGENLINKIGIAVLVLGIAFFVKYAIDKDWINEVGRIIIGLACGSILIGVAHRMRRNYRSFSSVLVGGGLTVFYFTIGFAFHQYQLLSQMSAFIIMVVITAFAVLLSVLYDRIELAILATIGGFITPFLLSTGNNNYVALFSYLGILNAGLIVLAYFKKWVPINFIAFFFTLLIYGGWLTRTILNGDVVPYQNGLLFASLFYVLFIIMQLSNHIKRPQQFTRYDFALLLAINSSYYAAGMILLQYWNNGEWQGLFTAFMAVLNCTLGWIFYKQKKFDRNFVYLLIGLTLSFISLAAPVQLEGNYITLFWAAEVVLLFWFYQQSGIKLVKFTASIVFVLALISLLMDWAQVYSDNTIKLSVFINKGCITGIAVSIACVLLYRLLYKEANTYFLSGIPVQRIRNGVVTTIALLLLSTGVLEIQHQFLNRFPGTNLHFIYLQLYIVAYTTILFWILQAFRIKTDPYLRLCLPLIVFGLYLFNIANSYGVEQSVLATGNYKQWFIGHWISILFLFLLIGGTVSYFRANYNMLRRLQNSFAWISSVALIILLSVEIRHLYIWFNYSNPASLSDAENLYAKAGLSIVWGLSSFALIWLGMKYKFKPLRIVALVLFGATIIKLFSYDIRNIPPGGKIVAFILLGVLLLTVSFMYQRLKKILIEDALDKK
jgi:uncharacterized membrane protein